MPQDVDVVVQFFQLAFQRRVVDALLQRQDLLIVKSTTLPARTASFPALLAQTRATCSPLRELAELLRTAAGAGGSALDALCGTIPLVYWLTSTDTTCQALPRKQLAGVARAALAQLKRDTVALLAVAKALLGERNVLKAAERLLEALLAGQNSGSAADAASREEARAAVVRHQLALHGRAQRHAHMAHVAIERVSVSLCGSQAAEVGVV